MELSDSSSERERIAVLLPPTIRDMDDLLSLSSSRSSCYLRSERGLLNDSSDSSSANTIELTDGSSSDENDDLAIGSSRKSRRVRPESSASSLVRCCKLLFGVCGIYTAYLSYGIVQEDLYSYRNSETGQAFSHVWLLQVLESSASIALGIVGRSLCGGRSDLKIRPFLLSGASQVFAKVFMSLSLVAGASFPVVTLAKSAKIVPVMLGQLLLGGSTYGIADYSFALLIVTGTVLLSLGNTSKNTGSNDTISGVAFVCLSLVMDGCTGGLQKQLKRDMRSTPPTTYDFVLYSHISMIAVALVISVITGDLWHGMTTIATDAYVARMVGVICCLSVLGQSFIFFVISNFDPLTCATVTTTRKMWSVLLSVAFRGHTLNSTGVAGLTMAASGLAIEVCNKMYQARGSHKRSAIVYPGNQNEHAADLETNSLIKP